MSRLIRSWLPAVGWMGAIYLASAQPSVPSVPGWWDLVLKKAMHVAAYAILTWLYLRALRQRPSVVLPNRVIGAGLAIAYALSDEYHQTFVRGRNGSLADVGIDAVGVTGVLVADWWRCRAASRPEQTPCG